MTRKPSSTNCFSRSRVLSKTSAAADFSQTEPAAVHEAAAGSFFGAVTDRLLQFADFVWSKLR
jgi:hypothetical protein